MEVQIGRGRSWAQTGCLGFWWGHCSNGRARCWGLLRWAGTARGNGGAELRGAWREGTWMLVHTLSVAVLHG
jgi:hypothetical protein